MARALSSTMDNQTGEFMSINAITPSLPVAPILSKVAPVAQTTNDNNGNTISINLTNNLLASSKSGTAVIANEIGVSVNGDNNNITINETNNIVIGDNSGGVTPTLNPDGTISLGSGTDAADTLIQEEIAVLITKDAQKQSDAYKKAQNIVQPVANSGTDLMA